MEVTVTVSLSVVVLAVTTVENRKLVSCVNTIVDVSNTTATVDCSMVTVSMVTLVTSGLASGMVMVVCSVSVVR